MVDDILLRHPGLLPDLDHAYAELPLDPPLDRLRAVIRGWADHADVLDSAELINHLTDSGFQSDMAWVLAASPVPLPACASVDAMPAEAEQGWWHIFGFLNLDQLRAEVNLARLAAERDLTVDTQRRLTALIEALNKVQSGEPDGTEVAA